MLSGLYLHLSDRLKGAYARVKANLPRFCDINLGVQIDNREKYAEFLRLQHPPDHTTKLQTFGRYLKEDDFPFVIAHTSDARVVPFLKQHGFNTLEELIWNRTPSTQ